MSIIYSFLQKRKMHESRHGYIMVFIAYLLSALLLALGSDAFYNINSKAADLHTEVKEETRVQPLVGAQTSAQNATTETDMTKIQVFGGNDTELEDLSTSGDTVWVFGTEMNGETFDTLMEQTGILTPKTKKETISKKVQLTAVYTEAFSGASSEDVDILERIVQAEAGGEDIVGKILIANVVINRAKNSRFPATIYEVVTQHSEDKYQFSPVKSGRIWTVQVADSTKKAVTQALQGVDYSKGALYFIAKHRLTAQKAKQFDSRLNWLFKHGGHDFYKQ